ncbi:MAG: MBL fold metallo-hydrolase [Candidatus Sumerlaeia bacterium]
MSRDWALPGLLETGAVNDRIMAVRDGLVNFFVVRAPDGLVLVDAGWRQESVAAGFEKLGLRIEDVAAVFLTHAHWDHARCADLYPNAKVFPGHATLPSGGCLNSADREIGVPREIAGLIIKAIATPGHTPDSVCYLVDGKYLFTGDTIFMRNGRAHLFPSRHNRDQDAARHSIRKLARLEGIECILTAHTGAAFDADEAFRNWRD